MDNRTTFNSSGVEDRARRMARISSTPGRESDEDLKVEKNPYLDRYRLSPQPWLGPEGSEIWKCEIRRFGSLS
jgi:hypothetical protein